MGVRMGLKSSMACWVPFPSGVTFQGSQPGGLLGVEEARWLLLPPLPPLPLTGVLKESSRAVAAAVEVEVGGGLPLGCVSWRRPEASEAKPESKKELSWKRRMGSSCLASTRRCFRRELPPPPPPPPPAPPPPLGGARRGVSGTHTGSSFNSWAGKGCSSTAGASTCATCRAHRGKLYRGEDCISDSWAET